MRWEFALVLCLLAGCARTQTTGGKNLGYSQTSPPPPPAGVETNKSGLIVTPGGAVPGKVVLVNPNSRYVVVNYPIGRLPPLERRLGVYRAGLKVGEIKMTGPQRDVNTVADIVAGECQVGDEVREE